MRPEKSVCEDLDILVKDVREHDDEITDIKIRLTKLETTECVEDEMEDEFEKESQWLFSKRRAYLLTVVTVISLLLAVYKTFI